MLELICECGEKASGPDEESVTAAMNRHLEASEHSLAQGVLPVELNLPEDAPDEAESAPTEGS